MQLRDKTKKEIHTQSEKQAGCNLNAGTHVMHMHDWKDFPPYLCKNEFCRRAHDHLLLATETGKITAST